MFSMYVYIFLLFINVIYLKFSEQIDKDKYKFMTKSLIISVKVDALTNYKRVFFRYEKSSQFKYKNRGASHGQGNMGNCSRSD